MVILKSSVRTNDFKIFLDEELDLCSHNDCKLMESKLF